MSQINVIEYNVGGRWRPTNIVSADGRTIKMHKRSCEFQFPKTKYRIRIYVRKGK